jgi:predicted metalloprotease
VRVRVIVAVSIIGLLTAGCFRVPVRSQPADPGARPAPTRSTGGSLEGRFSRDTMDQYVEAVVPMIRQWLNETWPQLPVPQVVYVPADARGAESCLDGSGRAASYSSTSFEYCGADGTVYLGQDMLWDFYRRTGDAGPAVGMAHEFGHHLQQELGVPSPRTATQSTRHEDQADCLAGAWTKYTDEQGWLEYPDDVADINALFPLIGSAEGPGRDHGTTSERA